MTTPAPARPGWARTHPYTVAALVVFLALSVPFCLRQDSEWENVFIVAAANLRAGDDVYRPEQGYLYPPFMAWAHLPFTLLPGPAARVGWLLLNLLALALMLRWAWRLAGGAPLEGKNPTRPREHLAALLGLTAGVFYLQNCLAHQQTDVLIGALLLGGCLLLWRGRDLASATCLGLAAACKCTPLLYLPYLLWRGRPRAALWLACVALGVNLLPDLTHPSPSGRPWLGEYAARYLRPLTESSHYVGSWGSDIVYNQSLAGAGQRWLLTAWDPAAPDGGLQSRHDTPGPLALRGIVFGAEAALLLLAAWCVGRPFRRERPADAEGVPPAALESSVVLLLMLLLSPMSSKAHFGVLLLPGFCLARAALAGRQRWLWPLLIASVVLALGSNKDPLGERLYTLTLWCGSVTWHTLLLLCGCLVLLKRQGARVGTGASSSVEELPRAA
jgi:hypothetical protein